MRKLSKYVVVDNAGEQYEFIPYEERDFFFSYTTGSTLIVRQNTNDPTEPTIEVSRFFKPRSLHSIYEEA